MAQWHLHLFGGVKLSGEDGEISRFLTVRCAKLLVLLRLSNGSCIRREQAAQLLWPEDPPDSSRLRLRQELHRLKTSLGKAEVLIGTSADEIRLQRDGIQTDLDLLTSGHDSSPIPTGEFLPGWDDHWVIAERTRAEALRMERLVKVSKQLIASGNPASALALVHPYSRENPLQESLRLLVVEAYSQMGRLASAVSEYQDYRRVVREQLGVELDPTAPISTSEPPKPSPVASVRWEDMLPLLSDETLGRDDLIEEVVTTLRSNPRLRMLTLVGPGGIGKTRLATEAIHLLKGDGNALAAFVTFAEMDESADWVRHMATQLEIEIPEAAVPNVYLAAELSQKPLYIVMDNLEAVLPKHLAEFEVMMRRAPSLRVLGTSTIPTRFPGERVLTVGPVAAVEVGVQFLRRGISSLQARSMSGEEDRSLVSIATQLDGYPLALKLAAARLRFLRPSELLTHLDSSLTTTRSPELAQRHRSLEVSLTSSLASLNQRQREALERIAMYPAGMCTQLASFEFEEANYLDIIEELLDAALLTFEDREGSSRVRVLQVVRAHLLSRLEPGRRGQLTDRAARCSLKYLETTGLHCWKPVSLAALARADAESDNIRFAWLHVLANDWETAVWISPMVSAYESYRARSKSCLNECLRLRAERDAVALPLELSIAHLGISAYVEAETLTALQRVGTSDLEADESAMLALAAAIVAFRSKQALESDPVADHALRLAEAAGNRYLAARCHHLLGVIANYKLDLPRCIQHLRKAVEGLADTGEEKLLVRVTILFAAMLWYDGRLDESAAQQDRATQLVARSQDPMDAAFMRETLGRMLIAQKEYATAIPHFEENLRMWRAVDCAYQEADQLFCLSKCFFGLGDLANCRSRLVESAEQWDEDNNEGGLCASMGLLAAYWIAKGEVELARQVVGFARAYRKEFGLAVVQSELDLLSEAEQALGGSFPCELPLNRVTALDLFQQSR